MAKKKSTTRSRPQTAEDERSLSGSNLLTGAVYHNGRMYDHKKGADQRAFAALVEKEGLAPTGTDPKERKKAHQDALQRLAEQGSVKGYGTKAASKKSGDREEDTGESTVVGSADQAREDGGAQVEDQE
jgi:hypothetical protein